MGNRFDNKDGEQNIAQGDHPIGKQTNNYGTVITTVGDQSPAVNGRDVTINYGVSLEKYEQIKKDLDITDALLTSFFKILEQGNVPREEWGVKLPEIASQHKELLLLFQAVSSDDPEVRRLKAQAKNAIEDGRFVESEELLGQARERDWEAVDRMKASIAEQQVALEKRQLSEAESCVEQSKLQRLQYRYAKSAEYWQEASAILPEGCTKERANCLVNAGYDLKHLGQYNAALSLYEQSLDFFHKIGHKQGQGMTLNNISQVYDAWGDYNTALTHLQQALLMQQEIDDKYGEITSLNNISAIFWKQDNFTNALKHLKDILPIQQDIKDRAGEGRTLNNISQIYKARGEYEITLECLRSSLLIQQEIGDKYGEVTTLNNIGQVYKAKRDYSVALKYSAQGLAKAKKIGVKAEEATFSSNIGRIYEDQGELPKAELYFSRAVKLMEQLEHPKLEEWREALEEVRAKLQEQCN